LGKDGWEAGKKKRNDEARRSRDWLDERGKKGKVSPSSRGGERIEKEGGRGRPE